MIVYFNYSVSWVFAPSYASPQPENMKSFSQIILKVDAEGNKTIASTEDTQFSHCIQIQSTTKDEKQHPPHNGEDVVD